MDIFNSEDEVTRAGALYLKTYSMDFILGAFKFNLNGFLNGCGRTTFTMITGIRSSLLISVPMAFLLAITLFKGLLGGLGFAAPIASLISMIVLISYIRIGRWREMSIKY